MNYNLESIEGLINLIEKQKIRIGLPNVNGFASDKRYIFKPILVNTILIIFLFKCIFDLFIEDKYISKIVANYSRDWDFSIQWNIFESLTLLFVLSTHIIFYNNYKNDIMSHPIRLNSNNSSNTFKTITLIVNMICIIYGMFYSLMAFLYCFEWDFSILLSITWAIGYFLRTTYIAQVFWKITSFILYCFRSKILLKNENNMLINIIEDQNRFKISLITKQLKRLNDIYIQINIWNRIWYNFIAMFMLYFTIVVGLITLQLYHGRFNGFIKILVLSINFWCIFLLSIFMRTASNVNIESKITYKILIKLFAKLAKNHISLQIKYKV